MADYTFYTTVYKGHELTEADFATYSAQAERTLAYYKRVYTVAGDENAENLAICAMAEAIERVDNYVSSTSVGSVSVSYADMDKKEKSVSVYRAACMFLDIYRGVG